jgi:RNA polymerase sigma-70 factor (ECF subfamily)
MDHRDQIYDQWLVVRCQENDVEALDELLSRWQERLWRHAVRITGDAEAAYDILQETMMTISRSLGGLVDPAAFPGWAYRIATNKCRDFFRRNRRHRLKMEAYINQPAGQEDVDPAAALDLHAALKKLPAPEQTLVSLRYEEGFSVAEIADILGTNTGTVKSRLHRARQRLRSLLEEK